MIEHMWLGKDLDIVDKAGVGEKNEWVRNDLAMKQSISIYLIKNPCEIWSSNNVRLQALLYKILLLNLLLTGAEPTSSKEKINSLNLFYH